MRSLAAAAALLLLPSAAGQSRPPGERTDLSARFAETLAEADTAGVPLERGQWVTLRWSRRGATSDTIVVSGPRGELGRTEGAWSTVDVVVPETGRYVARGRSADGGRFTLGVESRGVGDVRTLRGALAPGDTALHTLRWFDPDSAEPGFPIYQVALEADLPGRLVLDVDRFGEGLRVSGRDRATLHPISSPTEAEMKDGPITVRLSRPPSAISAEVPYALRVWSWRWVESEMPVPPPPPPGGR